MSAQLPQPMKESATSSRALGVGRWRKASRRMRPCTASPTPSRTTEASIMGPLFTRMRALLLVTALLLAACSRSPSLEGEYLSEREFLRISREDGGLVLDLFSREFAPLAPRRLATL